MKSSHYLIWSFSVVFAFGCADVDLVDGLGGEGIADGDMGDEGGAGDGGEGGADGEEGSGPSSQPQTGDPPSESDEGGAPSTGEPLPEPGATPEGVEACASFPLIWPTTNSDSMQTIVHDAYGPRLLGGAYDWHRGIDLPGAADDDGFNDPVHAAAAGTIVAIGNQPSASTGAISNFSYSSGNLVVIEHQPADLGGSSDETLYTLYMHLDELELDAFPVRIDGQAVEADLSEYFYLDGGDTNASNRGRPRATFKTSGEAITSRPRVEQHDTIGIIGDSGANYEHLHFEVRESQATSAYARNPYAYLPHLNETRHSASVVDIEDGLRVLVEVEREPGEMGSPTDLHQQLDVEVVSLQILDADEELVDELSLSFLEVNNLDDPDEPEFEFEGVGVDLDPEDFDSSDASWLLSVDFVGLEAAGFEVGAGEQLRIEVTDLCGNRFELDVD
ncbi:M23 family metallopeptidase [Pseudenhygromyxa sp. WMMC2535]|uniref:M23 family metallopeptidase n=1 Tax=Pseudenhygromyxa sp. WMMC2535 TaxID=2712867 RepID=UPI001554C919|nr:M23 family metallopeptidase [Pseudenhygromyxa sp. WMMC2535]NVB43188.1 M23 family metallopeptidase [Pseudenhygromyxa sp. WMMC2535]